MKTRIKDFFDKKLSSEEQIELLRLVETNYEWRNLYGKYKNSYALLALSDAANNKEESVNAYSRFKRKRTNKRIYTLALKSLGYAATILVIVFATHTLSQKKFDNSLKTTMNKIHVPAGQRINLTLQDGTEVWLNSKSTLTYPVLFSNNERHVIVEGEAFFNVAKDNKRPFIVSSKDVDIKVLGTQFNIYSYPQESYMETSLVEGKLQVYFRDNPRESLTLTDKQKVIIANPEMKMSATTDDDNLFLWKDGIYSFKNVLLIDILKKLELYYDVTIVVTDPSIFEWEYTGKFRQRDGINEILRMIGKIQKFKIETDLDNNIITLSAS